MKLVLIGGGDVGRGNTSYETQIIDKKVVEFSEKEKSNFLFIGLASSFSDSYYDTMKKIYKDLGCETVYLKKKNILNNPDIVQKKINDADIIYFCGGDAIKLVNDIKEYGIDTLLRKAKDRNCILCGISAGAIMLSKEGYSDSYILRGEKEEYDFVDGLDFASLSISPHFKINDEKTKALEKNLNSKKVIGIEDNAALFIDDDNYEVIGDNNIYLCTENKIEKINRKGTVYNL